MTKTTTETRPLRPCDVCGAVDDHPRHNFGTVGETDLDLTTPADIGVQQIKNAKTDDAKAAVLAHIQDRTAQLRHMDCCRDAGCPTGECDKQTAGAEDLRGMDLVDHIHKIAAAAQQDGN